MGSAGADNTSALAFGGDPPPGVANTESWNGSAWTEVNNLNTARQQLAGTGTVPAALAFGGNTGSPTAATESWNGTNWTNENNLNVARRYLSGAGTQSAGIAFSGGPPATAATEEWNGTGSITRTITSTTE
jgi:hypothetical protein